MWQTKIFILAAILLIPACTRKAEKTPLVDAPISLGPTNGDTTLPLDPVPTDSMRQALLLDRELDTASYLRLAEDLQALSHHQRSQYLSQLSRRLIETYRSQPLPMTKFSHSLYAQTMIGEGEPQVKRELEVVSREIRTAINAIVSLLEKSKKTFPWPEQLKNFPHAVTTADAYTKWLLERIPTLGLPKEMEKPLTGAIKGEYGRLRPVVIEYSDRLERSKNLSHAVTTVKQATIALDVKIAPRDAGQLRLAEELVQSIEATQSSQDALALVIQVWRAIPPEEREKVFKEAAPEFYDFLADKDELSLSCLAAPFCLNPILELARRLVILPKISEYGVAKIRSQIDQSARDHLISSVLRQASAMMPKVPELIKEKALGEAKKYTDLIATVRKDFAGFARKSISAWEKEEFQSPLRSLDPSRVKVRIRGNDRIDVALPKQGKYGASSGAEVLGLSLATAHSFLPEEKSKITKADLLDPIVKLLAVTGFRQSGGKLFPSFLLPLDGKRTEIFDVKNLLKGTTSYAVPDSFIVSNDMIMNRGNTLAANASVGAQAELLRGISRQIRFHRDWEQNLFDEKLGNVPIDEMVKELPKGAVDFSPFPKEMIFTVAVGASGAILQNIVRPLSPAFLVLPKGRVLWGDRYKEIGEGEGNVSTVAGLVNIEKGKRGSRVRTADLARYILALDEFLSATEGIEQTKSPQLNEKIADDRTVLEELQEARRYLRLFQLALTNFLVHVAQDKDGSFRSGYDLETRTADPGERTLTDQTLAIRALLASARQLDLKLFSWAALDGYYFMNRSMWDQERQFYVTHISPSGQKTGEASLLEIASTLRAGDELSSEMKAEGRRQWEQIAKPWVKAIEEL